MKSRRIVLVIVAAVLVSIGAAAHDHEGKKSGTMAGPQASQTLKAFDWFASDWRCQGTMFASPVGPERKTVTDVHSKWAMNGFWLTFDVKEQKTEASPMPMRGMAHWGWDDAQKKFVALWVDNFGAYSQQTSSGWDGDRFVFEGESRGAGPAMTMRDVFVRKSDTVGAHIVELQHDGKWMKLVEEECTKVAKK